jgi:hypothetical protein
MRFLLSFKRAIVALIALILMSAAADAGIFKRKTTVRGRIANVVATPNADALSKGGLGTLLIFGEGNSNPNHGRVWVIVTDETEIQGVDFSRNSFAILAAGMAVEIKFTGKVGNRYPAHGTAKTIKILNPSSYRR